MVAVVPRDKLNVTANADKLKIVDAKAAIQRHACTRLRRAHVRPHREQEHPFYGLDFIHTELSKDAGLVGARVRRLRLLDHRVRRRARQMGAVRARLRSWGSSPTTACRRR